MIAFSPLNLQPPQPSPLETPSCLPHYKQQNGCDGIYMCITLAWLEEVSQHIISWQWPTHKIKTVSPPGYRQTRANTNPLPHKQCSAIDIRIDTIKIMSRELEVLSDVETSVPFPHSEHRITCWPCRNWNCSSKNAWQYKTVIVLTQNNKINNISRGKTVVYIKML